MDQYVNNRNVEILQKLLADPAEAGQYYSYNLQSLISEYPQSGILRALLAHTNKENTENLHAAAVRFNSRLLYKLINAPESLQPVNPGQLIFQGDDHAQRVFHSATLPDLTEVVTEQSPVHEEPVAEVFAEPEPAIETLADSFVADGTESQTEIIIETEAPAEQEGIAEIGDKEKADVAVEAEPEVVIEDQSEEPAPVETQVGWEEEPIAEQIAEEPSVENENTAGNTEPAYTSAAVTETPDVQAALQPAEYAEHTVASVETEIPVTPESPKRVTLEDLLNGQDTASGTEIDDEVYDEIAGIESVHLVASKAKDNIQDDEIYDEITGIEDVKIGTPVAAVKTNDVEEDLKAQEDQLIRESLASADFFVFENIFDKSDTAPVAATSESTPEPASYFKFEREFDKTIAADESQAETQVISASAGFNTAADESDKQNVSKYFDEKLPYTFLWWLDKTRQEHADLYQPYAKTARPEDIKTFGDPRLQQLYYESIFQVSPPDEIGNKPVGDDVEFDTANKSDRIIERFIQQDPQINPPSSDKLDNENKAKRSSEDSNELVTETLARIYAEQMLYHKAIATYKKLMLKFPEKSRYFADHIENLEKKIN